MYIDHALNLVLVFSSTHSTVVEILTNSVSMMFSVIYVGCKLTSEFPLLVLRFILKTLLRTAHTHTHCNKKELEEIAIISDTFHTN